MIDWLDQEKLKQSYIIVIGAGAVGNEVLKNLCLLGVGKIHIIDFDRIEEHNLTRTILFSVKDLGLYKAEVASRECQKIDSSCIATFSNGDFWDVLSLQEIKKAAAVVCCVDNYEARLKLNQLCLLAGVDFYNTGIDSRYVCVESFPYSKEPDCACYECALPSSVYEAVKKRYSCGWLKKVALEEKKIPTTAITSSIAGATAVGIILQRLCNHSQSLKGSKRFCCDTITLNSTISDIRRNDSCPGCYNTLHDYKYYRSSGNEIPSKLESLPFVEDFEITFSEDIVFYLECKRCGQRTPLFESAHKLNDAITYCSKCNMQSNIVYIKDRLVFSEFHEIFGKRKYPGKFIKFSLKGVNLLIEREV